jgi:hypothetical protein
MEAIQSGSAVTVVLMHDDSGGRRHLHPVALSVSRTGITYDLETWDACRFPKTVLPLEGLQLQRKVYKGYTGGTYQEVFLELNLGRTGVAGQHSLVLWSLGSQVVEQRVIRGKFVGIVMNSDLVSSPNSANEALESLANVLHMVSSHDGQ